MTQLLTQYVCTNVFVQEGQEECNGKCASSYDDSPCVPHDDTITDTRRLYQCFSTGRRSQDEASLFRNNLECTGGVDYQVDVKHVIQGTKRPSRA